MATNIDIFEWRSLTESINKIVPPSSFLLDTIFKTKESHFADKVDIEIISGKQKLAHFVNKGEAAKNVAKNVRQIKTVTLPRIFEKKVFTADELANFKSAGNVYVGSAADIIMQSEMYKAQELAELKDRVTRRLEHMAATILTTGAYTVSQDNIDWTLSFDFHATEQLITLTGNNVWGGTTSNIAKNLREWKKAIFKRTGANATTLVLGTTAAEKFVSDTAIQALLDNWNTVSGKMDLTQPIANGANFLGRVFGLDVFEYSAPYVDDSDAEQVAFGDAKALLVAPDNSFRQHFGPIARLMNGERVSIQADTLVMPVTSNDLTVMEWQAETRPLLAVHNPSRLVCATIA